MSGAVGSPFTASMFRFDGLRILAVFIYVNTFSILLGCVFIMLLNTMNIYFLLDRIGHQVGRVLRILGTKNPARWPGGVSAGCYQFFRLTKACEEVPLLVPNFSDTIAL